MEQVYEQFFFLKYEAYNLPVGLRTWFVNRLVQQLQDEKKAVEEASKGKGKSQELSAFNQPRPPPGYNKS
jgi:hypothetical protein